MNVLLPILPGTLPPGTCYPSSPQDLLNLFSANQNAVLNGEAFYNYGNTKPDPSLNAYPWINTNDMRIYQFSGVWISPNPETSVYARRIFRGDATALMTYDGGDTNAPSDRSGPMWEPDPDFAGRVPMGIGAIPGSDPAKTLALSDLFGVGSVTIQLVNMPEHYHFIANNDVGGPSSLTPTNYLLRERYDDNYSLEGSDAVAAIGKTSDAGGDGSGNTTPIQTCSPVVGVQIIRRTSRIYYAVP